MSFYAVNSLARRTSLAVLVTVGLSAAAQQTIQFTKPVDNDTSSKANGFIPGNHNAANAFNAPASFFGGGTAVASFDILPGSPRPVVSGAQAAQWQKVLDDRKNWTLMTPEEILGIPTPEKILGVPDPSEDPTLTREERYLNRRDKEIAFAATNRLAGAEENPWQSDDSTAPVFQPLESARRDGENPRNSQSGANLKLNGLFGWRPDSLSEANRQSGSTWTSAFGLGPPVAEQTPEQLAGMDRFRALMEPEAQDKLAPAPAQDVSYQHPVAGDPNFEPQPVFNPAGIAVAPMQDSSVRPLGLLPLAGVAAPHLAPVKKTALVQTPPWMSSGLQNPTMPQRQF